MEDKNRPRGRQRNITGTSGDISKRGEGLGTGETGSGSFVKNAGQTVKNVGQSAGNAINKLAGGPGKNQSHAAGWMNPVFGVISVCPTGLQIQSVLFIKTTFAYQK